MIAQRFEFRRFSPYQASPLAEPGPQKSLFRGGGTTLNNDTNGGLEVRYVDPFPAPGRHRRPFMASVQRPNLLFVEGRIIYEMMETFWPSAARDESLPDDLREWGKIWTAAPKILVSNSRTTASHNTRIVGGADAITQLAAIRDETDGTIGVGGATLATQLLQHGLLDELLLYTHPAILGSGRPLFDEVTEPLECDLLEHATFENGVALNRYQIRGQRTE